MNSKGLCRGGIFKLSRSPGMNSKETTRQHMEPGGPVRQPFSYSVPSPPKRVLKFQLWLSIPQSRYTQRGKLAQAGEGWGCMPIPFHYIYHHVQRSGQIYVPYSVVHTLYLAQCAGSALIHIGLALGFRIGNTYRYPDPDFCEIGKYYFVTIFTQTVPYRIENWDQCRSETPVVWYQLHIFLVHYRPLYCGVVDPDPVES